MVPCTTNSWRQNYFDVTNLLVQVHVVSSVETGAEIPSAGSLKDGVRGRIHSVHIHTQGQSITPPRKRPGRRHSVGSPSSRQYTPSPAYP